MSHGLQDSNLGSKRLILAGDIKSRKWPNIGDSYTVYSAKSFLIIQIRLENGSNTVVKQFISLAHCSNTAPMR